MKGKRYFDENKSLIENGYYLCMVFSILFIIVQVFIARNSLENSSDAELTRHTLEQLRYYEASIGKLRTAYEEQLFRGGHTDLNRYYEEVAMEPRNLGDLSYEEIFGKLNLIDFTLIPRGMNSFMLSSINNPVITTCIDFAKGLDNMASIVLEGLVDEQMFYRMYGQVFLQGINTCAVFAYNPDAVYYNSYYGKPLGASGRLLYDIWWHRRMVEQKEFIVEGYKRLLAGDETAQELSRNVFAGLYAEGNLYVPRGKRPIMVEKIPSEESPVEDASRPAADYRMVVDADKDVIRNAIAALKREIREHERIVARQVAKTSIRNT